MSHCTDKVYINYRNGFPISLLFPVGTLFKTNGKLLVAAYLSNCFCRRPSSVLRIHGMATEDVVTRHSSVGDGRTDHPIKPLNEGQATDASRRRRLVFRIKKSTLLSKVYVVRGCVDHSFISPNLPQQSSRSLCRSDIRIPRHKELARGFSKATDLFSPRFADCKDLDHHVLL